MNTAMSVAIQEQPAAIGHNKGPALADGMEPSAYQELAERGLRVPLALAQRVEAMVAGANAWLARVPEIKDEDTARKCEDFLNQLAREWDAIDAARDREKRPHDEASKAIQNKFRRPLALIEACIKLLKPKKSAWLIAEQNRLRAEKEAKERAALDAIEKADQAERLAANTVEGAVAAEEARKAADAAVKAADAAPVRAQLRGDYSPRASGLRTTWSAEIGDYAAALAHYAGRDEVRAAVQSIADREARALKDKFVAPGCTPKSTQS